MSNSQSPLPHKLSLEERRKLSLTGATEVIRFDEDQVELRVNQEILIIQGSGLKLKCLSVDDGAVIITGTISAMIYEEPRPVRRLFR